jgi:hypothetical protein
MQDAGRTTTTTEHIMSTLTLGLRTGSTRTTEPGTGLARTVGLMAAAPFVGLAFIVLLPLAGLALLAACALEALLSGRRLGELRHLGLGVAAPFVGLAFVVALPVAGLATLATTAVAAATAPRAA